MFISTIPYFVKSESSTPREITRVDTWTKGLLKRNGEPSNETISSTLVYQLGLKAILKRMESHQMKQLVEHWYNLF